MAWQKPNNFSDWLNLLFRHRVRFFFAIVSTMILVIWAGQLWPRSYNAEAKFSRQNDSALTNMGSSTINQNNLHMVRLQMKQDLTGRAAVEALINDLQLQQDLPHTADSQLTPEGAMMQQDMINEISDKLRMYFQTQDANLDWVVVTYKDKNPDRASKIVNQAVDNYIRRTRLRLEDMLLKAREFYQGRADATNKLVNDLERKKLESMQKNPGLRPEDPLSYRTQIATVKTNLDAVETQFQINSAKRHQLEEFIKNQPEMRETKIRGQNPEVSVKIKKRQDIETELEEHRRLGRREEHPLVRKSRERLAELAKEIEALDAETTINTEQAPNAERLQAEKERDILVGETAGLLKRRDDLRAEIERLEVLDRDFFQNRRDFMQIDRELTEAQRQFAFWDDNLRRTHVSLTAEIGQRGVRLNVEQRANNLSRPSSPTYFQILSIAIAAGLGMGALMVILAELFDSSYHSVEQAVDGLKLPVLGAVNEIVTPQQRDRKRLVIWGLYPSLAVVMMLVLLGSTIIMYLSLEDPIRYEKIRSKATRLISIQ